ncbi:MAG: AlkZ family DNA glycosylase [Chloroflexi bacterium]|nr:AlkZ family DNA glycosylase [Chloroflexota bacterium]OJV88752.1 MAG: hypothetical protein BGO39_04415 [Chloroflexi bacterium 54-19]
MANLDIAYRRLTNQHIARPVSTSPAEVVRQLGAVQAQDYRAALWALGLRLENASETAIEEALSEGKVLRTHIMRPTWHYVEPEDIRWLLDLTGPRVEGVAAGYYRNLGLDAEIFKLTDKLIAYNLRDNQHLTKAELGRVFTEAGLDVSNQLRLTYIIFHAELTGLVCNGARQGNEITYALLDERVPPTPPRTREEAVIELVRRFFTSHGPATIPDFTWWSGLTAADARLGLDSLKSELLQETIDGQVYWTSAERRPVQDLQDDLYLLPNFDEYVVSYKNRQAIEDLNLTPDLTDRRNYLFNHLIVINGLASGLWKRKITPKQVLITYEPFRNFTGAENAALQAEADRYGRFVGLPVALETGRVAVYGEKK